MKKAWLAVIALPALAYPASAWYLGKQVEAQLGAQYALATQSIPNMKVVERQYARTIFDAEERVLIEVPPSMLPPPRDDQPRGPVHVEIRNSVAHGPFVSGALGAARAHSEVRILVDGKPLLTEFFGEQPVMVSDTTFAFDGSGHGTGSSPAFTASLTDPDSGEAVKLDWGGIQATAEFAAGMRSYRFDGRVPHLAMEGEDGVKLRMDTVNVKGDQRRLFEDDALLYTGELRMTLDSVAISAPDSPPITLGQLHYEIDEPSNGDFIDVIARMGAQTVDVGGTNYGPAHYDLSFLHLHARTLADLYRRVVTLSSDPAFAKGEGDPDAAMAALAEPAKALFAHDPRIELNRVSFSTPDGEFHVDAHASLPGVNPAAFDNPPALLAVLDAGANLRIPEGLLRLLAAKQVEASLIAARGEAPDDAEVQENARMMLDMQLGQFEQQGLLTRADGMVRSTLAFKNGQLTVNGKPFNPMAMR